MRSEPTQTCGSPHLLWLSHTCMLSGALALAFYSYSWVDARVYQALQNHFYSSVAAVSNCATEKNDLNDETTGSSIGRIDIPRLELSVVVLEGDDALTLRRGAGHIPGTGWLGQTGNMAIAGHRNTFFSGLRDIRKNDVIRITTAHRFYVYTVESIKVVGADDVKVLDGTQEPTLTLITCFPFSYIGPAPNRFVVHARQISSSVRAGSPACAAVDNGIDDRLARKTA